MERSGWLIKKSGYTGTIWSCLKNYRSSIPAAVAGCSVDFSLATGAFFLPGPAETLTIAGLKSRFPSRNPRRNSWITTPSLNSWDSSRAMASCSYNQKERGSQQIKLDSMYRWFIKLHINSNSNDDNKLQALITASVIMIWTTPRLRVV